MGYLTIESGLLGVFSFSFPSLSCLSSPQSGSHLTHRHTPSHTHTPRRSATAPMPKHPPHGYIQSPSSPSSLLLFCLSFCLTISGLAKQHMQTHMVTHTNTRPSTEHTLTPVHAQRRRDGKGWFCRMPERTEGGRVGRESATEERGKTEGGEEVLR